MINNTMRKKIVIRIILYIIVGVMIGYFYVRPLYDGKQIEKMCNRLSESACRNNNTCEPVFGPSSCSIDKSGSSWKLRCGGLGTADYKYKYCTLRTDAPATHPNFKL